MLQDLAFTGIRFVALVADNEAVNDALWERHLTPFPFLIRIPCAAHTIQLVVKQIMSINKFAATLLTVRTILSSFEKSKGNRMRLRSLQQGELREYQLVKLNDTRWNSHLYACQRLLLLKRFIDVILPQADTFWPELASLHCLSGTVPSSNRASFRETAPHSSTSGSSSTCCCNTSIAAPTLTVPLLQHVLAVRCCSVGKSKSTNQPRSLLLSCHWIPIYPLSAVQH